MLNRPLEMENQAIMIKALTDLEKYLKADVLVFYGPIVNGADSEIKDIIERLPNKKETLYVILTTGGGVLLPVQRIVKVFRHYYKEVNFIVPNYAFSAGTILCMSGDKIYMNYFSCLGPIDPQVENRDHKLVPALGYLDKINELLEKAKQNTLTQAEFLILKDFDLAELKQYEQAKDLAISLLKKWLTQYKFKDWNQHSDGRAVTQQEKENRAVEIAELLSDNKKWNSHGYPIDIETLTTELKLKIEDFSKDTKLNSLIVKYNDCLEEYINIKKYQRFVQTRNFI
mgnify:FL=1